MYGIKDYFNRTEATNEGSDIRLGHSIATSQFQLLQSLFFVLTSDSFVLIIANNKTSSLFKYQPILVFSALLIVKLLEKS